MFKKILIASDGSEISKRAAEHGLALAKDLGAQVVAVFVIDTRAFPGSHPVMPESVAPYYFSLIDELRKMGERATDEVSRSGQERGVTVHSEIVEGTPATSILEVAKKHGVDLLVMGTHGRSGIAAMLLGSTAQAVVHRSELPVLVVR